MNPDPLQILKDPSLTVDERCQAVLDYVRKSSAQAQGRPPWSKGPPSQPPKNQKANPDAGLAAQKSKDADPSPQLQTDAAERDDIPLRPGISRKTLALHQVKIVKSGDIQIPYFDLDGELTSFRRYRLAHPGPDGRRYTQETGSQRHAYFPLHYAPVAPDNQFGLPTASSLWIEGEFKDLALWEVGLWAIGLPGFGLYSNNGNDEPELLSDLRLALEKFKPQVVFFLGDSDVVTNYEFSRNATFLARAIAPIEVRLPIIPLSGPGKGIDDCREALGDRFAEFFHTIISQRVGVAPKLSTSALALLLLEPQAKAFSRLGVEEREKHFRRLRKLVTLADNDESNTAADNARLLKCVSKILGITLAELKDDIYQQHQRDRAEFKEKHPADDPSAGQEKDAQAQLQHAQEVLSTIEAYYDGHNRSVAVRTASGFWEVRSEDTFRRLLRMRGVSTEHLPNRRYSAADWIIEEIQKTHPVDYVGELAGRKIGYYLENGLRILVTRQAQFPDPAPGSCEMILSFIRGLLTDKPADDKQSTDAEQQLNLSATQFDTVIGWIKIFRGSLVSDCYHQGQVLALAGPVNCGKSLFQKMLTRFFGGRFAKAGMFIKNKTSFNADLARAEHLLIEDESAIADRYELGSSIKALAVNENCDVHPKGRDKLCFALRQRLSISCNDRAQRLLILPPLDDDIADKIILLRCGSFPFPMPLQSDDEITTFWETFDSELPAFFHYLDSFQIPEELRDRRFGVKSFHHPELARHLHELSPQAELLELIDLLAPWGAIDPWQGSSIELRRKLLERSTTRDDAKRILKYHNACGEYLGDLAKLYPKRIQYDRKSSRRLWIIAKP